MNILQISVFLENKQGQLAELCDFLYQHRINMQALSIADTADFGILRIIVDEPEKTLELLRAAGYTCTVTEVLAVEMSDEPGAMAKIIRTLSDKGVFIEYTYAFPTAQPGKAVLIFRVADNNAAEEALRDTQFEIIGKELLNK